MLKPREQVAAGNDVRKAHSGDGREAAVSRSLEHVDHASAEPPGHGTHRNQDTLGMKIQGTNLERIQQPGAQVQKILSGLQEIRSVFAERVSQGFYINIEVNRAEAARYGLPVADVQRAINPVSEGSTLPRMSKAARRYPINVRYQPRFSGQRRRAAKSVDRHPW